MESAQADFASIEADVPEPDWNDFRSSVRDELLSRSVQRASTVRRWTGWPIRPAMAWGLSMVIAIGATTGAFLWHIENRRVENPPPIAASAIDSPIEAGEIEREMSVWSQTGVFEALAQLESVEQEHLRDMLQSAEQETSK
jgi:hypothetical protein